MGSLSPSLLKIVALLAPSGVRWCFDGQGEEHSFLGGAEDVLVNPLEPGEEQTVTVMQQAPDFEAWSVTDEWALVGDGLDFVDQDGAKAQTPVVTVIPRPARGAKKSYEEAELPTLADTVFVAPKRIRRGSSQYSSSSSSHHRYFSSSSSSSHHHYFNHPGSYSSHHPSF